MKTEQVTIELQITTEVPHRLGGWLEVGLLEHIEVSFDTESCEYHVVNPRSDLWQGSHPYRQGAILDYLRSRLAIPKA